jgi:predicted small integral membrane protein
MSYSVPLGGYALVVLIIMFGGRKRRTFNQATQAAAGVVITLLSLSAILWFVSSLILQVVSAEH